MLRIVRQISGISIFWLALSLLFDGLNTLIIPNRLANLLPVERQASMLGLLTSGGLLLGMLVQPLAGSLSDRLAPRWGRKGMLSVGLAGCLAALAVLGVSPGLVGIAAGFTLAQIAASWAQAAQQGFLPDLMPARLRGTASGVKGLMDMGGALLGFILLGELLGSGQSGLALALTGAVLVVTFLLTVVLVRERRGRDVSGIPEGSHPIQPESTHQRSFLDAFRLDLSQPLQRAFLWSVVARFLFLLGTYAVGRFLLLFVASRLGIGPNAAAQEAGGLLAGLALVTVAASAPAGWAADRLGRLPMMWIGAGLSAVSVMLLSGASTTGQMLLYGMGMALGSAAFAGASWALTADLAPPGQAGRFYGLANFGTAGAAAAAGLFGPLVDIFNASRPGTGYTALFLASALAFVCSALPLIGLLRVKSTAQAGVGLERQKV